LKKGTNFYIENISDGKIEEAKQLDILPEKLYKYFILLLSVRTLRFELFHEIWKQYEFNKEERLYTKILYMFVSEGFFTGFKMLIDKVTDNVLLETLFNKACDYNYINIARYFNQMSRRYQLQIMEDKIYKHKYLNIFEYYLETEDLTIILNEIKNISLTTSEEICPICKAYDCNIKTSCNHEFCDKCLFGFWASSEKQSCPLCRHIIL